MAEKIKVLAQLLPVKNTLSDLYVVPAATSTAVSSIIICNQNGVVQISFRVSIAVNGVSDDLSQYIYYDMPLATNDTFIATVGLTLNSGDVVRVYTNNSNVSFSLYGSEVS